MSHRRSQRIYSVPVPVLVKKSARGFRNPEHFRIAISFRCGALDLYPGLSRPLLNLGECGGRVIGTVLRSVAS